MKNYIAYIIISIILVISFSSCKNDLDVLAPGKESISVYGILNPNESIQNIRINKVYITDGDALTAGQNENTINYGAGELTVTLQRFMSLSGTTPTLTTIGNASKKEILLTESVVTTKNGTFNQNQRIWQTTDKLYTSGVYKLTVKNNITGAVFSSENVIIDSVKSHPTKPFIHNIPNYPGHGQYIVNGIPGVVTPQSGYIDYSVLTVTQKIRFRSILNAKLYNVVMRFHYIDSLLNNTVNYNYVDYNFPTVSSEGLAGGEELEVTFPANDFYTNAATEITKKAVSNLKSRKANYIEYIIYSGAESLSNFLQVNAPSTTIAQDKPYFTNINGGVGIFSSRSRSSITHDLWIDFVDKIACHPSTFPLLFCNSTTGKPVSNPCN